MKPAVIGFLILVAGILYVGPYVNRQKACYDGSMRSINDIKYEVASRSIPKESVCEKRLVVLESLESCLRAATGSGQLISISYPLIEGSLSLVRPVGQNVQSLKGEHNLECEEFPDFRTDTVIQ